MSEPDLEKILGMHKSTAYALLAYKEGRRAQLWLYIAGFFSGAAFTLLALALWFVWIA